jgi:phosphoribosylformimino-5-aminoimidazole carboxamide ribotide isomerase
LIMVIPAIDLKEGKCVRLQQGNPAQKTVYSEDPVQMARRWESKGAEFLHVVDLDGAFLGFPVHLELMEKIAKAVKIPIQVGGGLRSLESITDVLERGAQRVILGTRAIGSPHFLEEACHSFKGRILLGMDARGGYLSVDGWTRSTILRAVDFAQRVSSYSLAGIVYTDISRDGMLEGPNLAALGEMAEALALPVIASGGISSLEDVRAIMALEEKGIVAMIIGKALYSGKIDLSEAVALTRVGGLDAG